MDKLQTQKTAEQLVDAIIKEKNLKAEKHLEKIIAAKCENRIKSVLKQ